LKLFCTLTARLLAQGLLRVRGRPAVAYDQQGLVFAVAMEGGAIKLFDVRSYDKVSNSFDTARQCFCAILAQFKVSSRL
jgi:hypothetical protein